MYIKTCKSEESLVRPSTPNFNKLQRKASCSNTKLPKKNPTYAGGKQVSVKDSMSPVVVKKAKK